MLVGVRSKKHIRAQHVGRIVRKSSNVACICLCAGYVLLSSMMLCYGEMGIVVGRITVMRSLSTKEPLLLDCPASFYVLTMAEYSQRIEFTLFCGDFFSCLERTSPVEAVFAMGPSGSFA